MHKTILISVFLCGLLHANEAIPPAWNKIRNVDNVPVKIGEDTLRWKVDSGTGHQYPMPKVVGDKVLIMGNGKGNPDPVWGKALSRGGSLVCRSLEDGKQIWRLVSPGRDRSAGFGICGEPVVEGDRLYVVAMYDVYCIDLNGMADGNQGLQDELELMTRSPFNGPKPKELPEWATDIIWFFSFSGMGVRIQDAISCSPLSVGGQIWVSTSHEMGSEARGYKNRKTGEYKPAPPAPHMIVLDKETGKLIATDKIDVPIIFHGEWSSPAAVTANGETVVIFGDGYGMLHGFQLPTPSPDGTPVTLHEYWTFDLNPKEARYDGQGRRHPYCLDTRLTYKYPLGWIQDGSKWIQPPDDWASISGNTKETDWRKAPLEQIKFRKPRRKESPGPDSSTGPAELIAVPAVVDNRVYVGIGRDYNYTTRHEWPDRKVDPDTTKHRKGALGRFMCLQFDDVTKPPAVVWEDRDVARLQSTASIHNGLVYVADLGGFLNCWEADTGKLVYRYDLGASVRERSQLVADGKIYIANDRKVLKVLSAGREPKLLHEHRFHEELSTVEAADGVLVVVTPKDVMVFGTGER